MLGGVARLRRAARADDRRGDRRARCAAGEIVKPCAEPLRPGRPREQRAAAVVTRRHRQPPERGRAPRLEGEAGSGAACRLRSRATGATRASTSTCAGRTVRDTSRPDGVSPRRVRTVIDCARRLRRTTSRSASRTPRCARGEVTRSRAHRRGRADPADRAGEGDAGRGLASDGRADNPFETCVLAICHGVAGLVVAAAGARCRGSAGGPGGPATPDRGRVRVVRVPQGRARRCARTSAATPRAAGGAVVVCASPGRRSCTTRATCRTSLIDVVRWRTAEAVGGHAVERAERDARGDGRRTARVRG